MQVSQVYSVGVAFADLGDEGTYRETLLALTHLQNVTADIFGRIEARVNLLKKRGGAQRAHRGRQTARRKGSRSVDEGDNGVLDL